MSPKVGNFCRKYLAVLPRKVTFFFGAWGVLNMSCLSQKSVFNGPTFKYKHILSLYLRRCVVGEVLRWEFFGSVLLVFFFYLYFIFEDFGLLVIVFILLIFSALEGKDYTGKGLAWFFPSID